MGQSPRHVAILGSVGVPACYGGFETLAEQLAHHHDTHNRPERLSITCSAPAFADRPKRFAAADLSYLPCRANGGSSVPYDVLSLLHARRAGADVALLLGVSGALALPLLAGGKMRIIVHVDGQEWRRAKWSRPARHVLKTCERLAVQHADAVIADSPAIADDIYTRYGRRSDVLTYGGDQGIEVAESFMPRGLPNDYALAICRVEPENNVEMLLRACAASGRPLVCVGNWNASRYGRALRTRFASCPHLHLLDPVYAKGPLQTLRRHASLYLHGHSAGGTNPSLVEMMHVGRPILAYDCVFNRQTTQDAALYFSDIRELTRLLHRDPPARMGLALKQIAQTHYRWADVGAQYFELFERVADAPSRLQKSKMSSRNEPRRFFFLPRS